MVADRDGAVVLTGAGVLVEVAASGGPPRVRAVDLDAGTTDLALTRDAILLSSSDRGVVRLPRGPARC